MLRALIAIVDKLAPEASPSRCAASLRPSRSARWRYLALGFRSLSLTPSALRVKAMLLDLDIRKAEALIRPLIDNPPQDGTIRERLEQFAVAEGLQL